MADETKIIQSLDYIEENLKSEISLDALSAHVFLSKYYYHRLFHMLTGESVKRYILKRRMASAAKDLVQTPDRILDIAVRYQFGSQEAFTRAFKRVYGTTPGEYRRQYSIEAKRHSGHSGMTCRAA